MEMKFKVKPPQMPNFVTIETPPGKREEGLQIDRGKIPITEFTEIEAKEYAELMKQTFMSHWKKCVEK